MDRVKGRRFGGHPIVDLRHEVGAAGHDRAQDPARGARAGPVSRR